MKAKTLFKAYREAVDRRAWAVTTRRDGTRGIEIDNDQEAVAWRRYNQLAEKVWARLVDVLGEHDAGPLKEKLCHSL